MRNRGTQDPEDRRPIVVLLVVYRVWAALRARVFRAWLVDTGLLPKDGFGKSADALAAMLSHGLSTARAEGKLLAGVEAELKDTAT